jgi:hypothetical protein
MRRLHPLLEQEVEAWAVDLVSPGPAQRPAWRPPARLHRASARVLANRRGVGGRFADRSPVSRTACTRRSAGASQSTGCSRSGRTSQSRRSRHAPRPPHAHPVRLALPAPTPALLLLRLICPRH